MEFLHKILGVYSLFFIVDFFAAANHSKKNYYYGNVKHSLRRHSRHPVRGP